MSKKAAFFVSKSGGNKAKNVKYQHFVQELNILLNTKMCNLPVIVLL